jgi:thymidylate synthase (FAD)
VITRVQLLDHGYCTLIETWGTEERIIESARMSTGRGFLGWGPKHAPGCREGATHGGGGALTCACGYDTPGDEKFLRFLYENAHATPFEMAGATFEVQAPIMVFREWHRHRVPFGYNELSARYTPLPDVNYVPTVGRIVEGARAAGKNKQAQSVGEAVIDDLSAIEWLDELAAVYAHAESVYQSGLRRGVPKELARLPVPVGRYSRMRVTGNLRGWLGFLKLREAQGAQLEIRVFANAVHGMLAAEFPRTMALFEEGSKR